MKLDVIGMEKLQTMTTFKGARDYIKAFLNKLAANSNPMKHKSFTKKVTRKINRELMEETNFPYDEIKFADN